MSVFKIDISSTQEEIQDFYDLYMESHKDLCIWKGHKIISLDEYINPTTNIKIFFEHIDFTVRGLGITIYYTHNDDVITCIALVSVDEKTDCYVKINYLCGNQKTNKDLINGKSQGTNMLDFIFRLYRGSVILIEPATPELIGYYTRYKEPNFPYDKLGLQETYNFLIYGNLRTLHEECFNKLFRSIKVIDMLERTLDFDSISDLYSKTSDVMNLKAKLITKLEFLVKTKQINAENYEQIIDRIMTIQYYDIHEILVNSHEFSSRTEKRSSYIKSGGTKYKTKKGRKIKNKEKIRKKRKTRKN